MIRIEGRTQKRLDPNNNQQWKYEISSKLQ